MAELCGYIGDKRFVKPLIEALDKPDNFERKTVIAALVRMRIEPYYSDYVKSRTRTLEQVKAEHPGFEIDELVDVLRTQESFLELSKYLLSDVAYKWAPREIPPYGSIPYPMYQGAFGLIRDNIKNEDIQQLIGGIRIQDASTVVVPLYDWMQKNYGKYKIKRIW